ncbi:MAG: MBL fold metallo-hydrolase [Desulfobulbus sp.]|jgi:phosphoribosyl 1,2-cyclic phosphodiesterase
MIRFSVLGSGSKGNATLVVSESARILIDNGFSGKELVSRLKSLGIAAESLTALVLTHEHTDHVRGAGVLARRLKLPIYANAGTYRGAEGSLGRIPEHREFGTGEPFAINGLMLHPFAVVHDAADPVGFVVSDGELSLGHCTDTGRITRVIRHHLQRCQALVLEANHDVQLLRNGPYPPELKRRVLSSHGHLANPDSVELADALVRDRLRCLVFAHLSEVNNRPELVSREIRRGLTSPAGLRVELASQWRVGPLLAVGGTGEAAAAPSPPAGDEPVLTGTGMWPADR